MFSGCLEMDGGPGALETDCYFCLWYCHARWYLVQWVTLVWHPPASPTPTCSKKYRKPQAQTLKPNISYDDLKYMYYLLTENMYSTISGAKDFLLHMVMFSGCSGGDPLLLGSTEFLLAESGLICVGLETFSAAVAYPQWFAPLSLALKQLLNNSGLNALIWTRNRARKPKIGGQRPLGVDSAQWQTYLLKL